jgi:glyoxylase-like metal-dependent hydrolase (beta-lactamase superfamily II)
MKTSFCGAVILTLMLLGTNLPAQETNQAAAMKPAGTRGSKFDITVVRLSPRVAVFYGDPWTNAVVAIAAQKGIIVVDAPFSKTISQGFRDAIQAEFKRTDFACLINSHEDMCHIGGNEAYADLPIIGHESLRRKLLKWMADPRRTTNWLKLSETELAQARERQFKADPKKLEEPAFADIEKSWKLIQADYRANPVLVPPTITFDREMTLYLGDITARLVYYGCAHGGADIIVSIPEENIVLTGGLFYPTHVPMVSRAAEQATPEVVDNWFTVMHAVLKDANENTQFLPSHDRGIMKEEQCAQFVSYLEKLWAGLRRARADGQTLEQARTGLPRQSFPEVANLPNEKNRGTQWEILDIHQRNIGFLWKVLGKSPVPQSPVGP